MPMTLKFSESKEMVDFGARGKLPVREAEIDMLKTLFKFARAGLKDLDIAFDIAECLDQLKNIIGTDAGITFTERNIKYLRDGYEFTVGQRQEHWFNESFEMLRQIRQKYSAYKETTCLNKDR